MNIPGSLSLRLSIFAFFFLSGPEALLNAASAGWGETPLGKVVEPGDHEESVAAVTKRQPESRHRVAPAEGEPLILAEGGKARSLIVVPAKPSGTEQRAAELLRSTLQAMSGGEFAIQPEGRVELQPDEEGKLTIRDRDGRRWESAIWVGNTARAEKEQITAGDLLPEGYRLVTRQSGLFIVGNDAGGRYPLMGTFFGAASFLEERLGVRWLWPGALGTVIPKSPAIVIPPLNVRDEPALPQRIIRNMPLNSRARTGLSMVEGSDEQYRSLGKLQGEWLASQKAGGSIRVHGGHAYGQWYAEYGKEHPEWFALQPDGRRVPVTEERPRLCEANAELAREIARRVLDAHARNPSLQSISISPNDGSRNGYCMCEACRKLDPPNGEPVSLTFEKEKTRFTLSYPSLSDRVAVFYNRVAAGVAKENPHLLLGAYAYDAYRDAPLGVKIHPSIVIGFVGLRCFDEAGRQSDLKNWDRWASRTSRLYLRPNIFHQGEGLPAVYIHALQQDIRHCYETGMMAADFDSLIGHWATQGLNYYVLAKLLWNPAADADALLADYCEKGFGAAAPEIEGYFRLLEEATMRVAREGDDNARAAIREEEQDDATSTLKARWKPFEKRYFSVFNQEKIEELRVTLHRAQRLAAGDETVLERIGFLSSGLDYADHFRSVLESPDDAAARMAFLSYFRRVFEERPQVVNSAFLLWRASIGRLPRLSISREPGAQRMSANPAGR